MEDIIITTEGLTKAQKELEERLRQRKAISERVGIARDFGDLSENSEYQMAKEQQGENETRIAELTHLIRFARVYTSSTKHHERIEIGSRIKVVIHDKEEKEFKIVGANEAQPTQGLISHESPLGSALLGKKRGEEVRLALPRGIAIYKVKEIF